MAKKATSKKKPEGLNRIKEVAAEKGFTQSEIAKRMDVETMTVSRWYTNSVQPHLSDLKRLAKVLNVSMCDLLNEEG